MTNPKQLETFLSVRLNREIANVFRAKSKEYGGVSEILRELVLAFNDDRVTVRPDPSRKTIFTQP